VRDTGVDTEVADRYVALIERLQDGKRMFAPEILAIGDELISLGKHISQKRDEQMAKILNSHTNLQKES